LIRNIVSNADHRVNPEQLRELHTHLRTKRISRVSKFIDYILKWIKPVRVMWNYGEKSGWHKGLKLVGKETSKPSESATRERSRSKGSKEKSSPKTPVGEPKPDLRGECKGCGRRGHKREECRGKQPTLTQPSVPGRTPRR
jgi:hypothetical protein